MKKYLLGLAVLAMASIANAATLNWSIMNINQPNTTTKANGYLAYLFITEQADEYGATTTTMQAVKDLIESGAEFYTEGTGSEVKNYIKKGDDKIQIAATGSSVNGSVNAPTGYYGNFGPGDSLKGFAVVFDADSLAGASNYIVTAERSASWTSTTGAKSLAFGSQGNATWTPVPEPSTAALALAGLALLLKRRRA